MSWIWIYESYLPLAIGEFPHLYNATFHTVIEYECFVNYESAVNILLFVDIYPFYIVVSLRTGIVFLFSKDPQQC